jgi:hypothetical protein
LKIIDKEEDIEKRLIPTKKRKVQKVNLEVAKWTLLD